LDWTEELRTRRNEALQDAIRSQLEGRLKSEISDLQKRARDAGGQADEDADADVVLARQSEPENFICPISKSPFLEPVKNPECGHTYSSERAPTRSRLRSRRAHTAVHAEAAILGLFSRRNPIIKCPVAGCDKRVQAGTLFADREMEHRMSKRRPRAAASSSSSSSAAAAAAGAAGPAADAEAGEIDATQ
jgi:SUMO ligase MMS21 Smc5/6 complex component